MGCNTVNGTAEESEMERATKVGEKTTVCLRTTKTSSFCLMTTTMMMFCE